VRVSFAEYDRQTEELIRYVLERTLEDDTLAGAMRRPRLIRALTLVAGLREDIDEYRAAKRRVVSTTGARRRFWLLCARYMAFCIRTGAKQYSHRDGYDVRWRWAPR
jgi:hypothetical protein